MASKNQQESSKPALRKPTFTKIDQIKPGSTGNTLIGNVISSNAVLNRGGPRNNTRIAECLVGDDTGVIIFTARNDQVDLLKPGTTVIIRNSKVDMFKNTMRLAVDKWGRIEVTEPASFTVNEDNNVSLVEYELVSVAEE